VRFQEQDTSIFAELTKPTRLRCLATARRANPKEKGKAVSKSAKSEQQAKPAGVPLVVTTKHRGVFFGYGRVSDAQIIRLEQARMCVYWAADVKSVVGLAANGPSKGCKIGPAAPAITLQEVTSVMECSKEAEGAWNAQPWS
jgi:hypothetical protein